MALLTVIRIFVLTIIVNMILPSGDVYSDIAMMYETWTFRNTESLESVGCRACYSKKVEDLAPSTKDCTLCVTKNFRSHCGGMLTSLKKLVEYENANKCEDLKWAFSLKNFAYPESERCDEKRTCCFETKNEFSNIDNSIEEKTIYKYLDSKLLVNCEDWFINGLNSLSEDDFYDVCLLVGTTTELKCEYDLIDPNRNPILNYIKTFLKENKDVFTSKNFNGAAYKLLVKEDVPISGSSEFIPVKVDFIPVKVDKVDESDIFGCGIIIKPKHVNILGDNLDVDCGLDSCKLHLDYLHHRIDGMHDLKSWQTKTVYWSAIRAGGKNCHLLRVYAFSMAIPIAINFLFSAMIFFGDVKSGVSSKFEIPILLLLCYPQWRTFKILIKYFKNKKQEELTNDLEENNKNVSSIEPFCESGFQVSIL